MGLSLKDLHILTLLKEQGHIANHSSVIEIGAQQCANNFLRADKEVEKIGKLFNVSSPNPLPKVASNAANEFELQSSEAPAARIFWEWLGFCYKSVDIDGSHDSVFLDLNYDKVPKKERGKYQIVTNYGTTEHIANQLNAFKIIHDLTAVGGIMIHSLPAQGMMNHGLVNYNPKFFWMLARSNGYQWLYFDYTFTPFYSDLPQNIIDHIKQYSPCIAERAKEHKTTEAGLTVALKKVMQSPYVSPLDVGTGIKTNNKKLERRYWSVFQENPFKKFTKTSSLRLSRFWFKPKSPKESQQTK